MIYKKYFKRPIDFILSLIALISLSPLFLIIGIAIKLDSEGPIFFKQERVGKHKKNFIIYKFRTMVQNAEEIGNKYRNEKDDPRITKVGKLLRTTSLDELPQLINIFKGEMSIIGPRPTLNYIIEKMNKKQLQRLDIKPGVTGLAQVNGRQKLTWKEKAEYDLRYVKKLSFIMDVKILFKTFVVIFKFDEIHKEELKKEDEEL